MENSTRVTNDLEMYQSGRNKCPTMVVMDKFSKSSSCNNSEKCEEQVRDHLVANEEAIRIPAVIDGHVEIFGKDEKCPKRERHMPREWWKNHTLSQHNEEHINVAIYNIGGRNAKGIGSLMANNIWKLTNLPKDHKNVECIG
jgi:hypothetical protein